MQVCAHAQNLGSGLHHPAFFGASVGPTDVPDPKARGGLPWKMCDNPTRIPTVGDLVLSTPHHTTNGEFPC
jgi:hypothetical protein